MAIEEQQTTAAEMADPQQSVMVGTLNKILKRAVASAWEEWQQTYAGGGFANSAREVRVHHR